jgi:hypothetical protein
MEIGFDVISDLHLDPNDNFNWENKATSLYCIVAGNVSSDLRTIWQTLGHLSNYYQGIFYVPGYLEYENAADFDVRTKNLLDIVKKVPNVAMLYHHVVVMEGVAILGCNGWALESDIFELNEHRAKELAYLKKSIKKLQTHLDVKKIIVVTNSVPDLELYYGEIPFLDVDHFDLTTSLDNDTEHKITHWVFGSHKKIVDTSIGRIKYVNNPYYKVKPYWAKRIVA